MFRTIRFTARAMLLALPLLAAPALEAQDSGADSTLLLLGGTVNGSPVDAGSRVVVVSPGAAITGRLELEINSAWRSGAVMAIGITPTWGDHATSYRTLPAFRGPVFGLRRTVDLGPLGYFAPTTPGVYHLIVAFRAEFTAGQVMSATNWGVGTLLWNNGDDVAEWSADTIAVANRDGTVLVDYQGGTPPRNDPRWMPATAVEIVVPQDNRPPVADAGPDQLLAAGDGCEAVARLDGGGSFDPDGDPLAYSWETEAGDVVTGEVVHLRLPLGLHRVTLTVDDGRGGSDRDEVVITVVDTTPPRIDRVTATPDELWPPNHLMHPVELAATAIDECSAALCELTSISSNQPADGTGDGATAVDWEIVGPLSARLRAERSGSGERIYALEVVCRDDVGNDAAGGTEVRVPRDQDRQPSP